MDYATILQLVQDELENDETTFVANIPNFVKLAEEEIYRFAQLQFLQKNSTSAFTISSPYLQLPDDFISPLELTVTASSTQYPVYPKGVSFIRAAYPSAATTGRPRYYALFDHNTLIVGPTPDSAYVCELHYIYKPSSIVDTSTTWLGDNAESALLYCTMKHAYIYEKGEKEKLDYFNELYQNAVVQLKSVVEGRNLKDEFKVPKKSAGT